MKRASNQTAPDGTFRSLVLTFGAFRRAMEPYFANFGIRGAQWAVLRTLARARDEEGVAGLRVRDLSDRLVIRPPSVTEVINRLRRMDLVSIAVIASDQRAKHVRLTAAGRKLVNRVLESHPHQIESVLGGLNRTERRQLGQLLDRLRDHLNSLPTELKNGNEQL